MANVSQAAVLAYRLFDGEAQVLLITSRGRRRWVLPKGHVTDGQDDRSAAAREAHEEAGLSGNVAEGALGTYTYRKFDQPPNRIYKVQVFPMEVTHVADEWPERSFRERRWMTFEVAASVVEEPGLAELLREFGRMLDTLLMELR